MGIMPQKANISTAVDLRHLAVSHGLGPHGERIQIRNTKTNHSLVTSLSLEAAARFSAELHRDEDLFGEFAVRLDRAIADAVYATVARTRGAAR